MDYSRNADVLGHLAGRTTLRNVMQPEPGDEKCMVTFFAEWKDSKSGDPNKGHMQEFVKILFPGDNKAEMVYEATDRYKARWPRQYAAFKGEQEQLPDGKPLSQWAGISKSWVDTLKHSHVLTVEQLAGLSDAQIQAVGMGCRELHTRAKAYIAEHQGMGKVNAVAQENEQLKRQLEDLQAQVNALSEVKRGPGRPKKDEAA